MSDPAQIAEGAGYGSALTAGVVIAFKLIPWNRLFPFLRWAMRRREENVTQRRTTTLETNVAELEARVKKLEEENKP